MRDLNYVAIDLETTGLDPVDDEIIELAAVRFMNGREIDRFSTLVRTSAHIPLRIQRLTGITQALLDEAPPLHTALESLRTFCSSFLIVGYYVSFDMAFLRQKRPDLFATGRIESYDCLELARLALPTLNNHRLSTVCKALDIMAGEHRALGDARACGQVFPRLLGKLSAFPRHVLTEIADIMRPTQWPLEGIVDALARQATSPSPRPAPQEPAGDITDPDGDYEWLDQDKVACLLAEDSAMAQLLAGFEERSQQQQMLALVTEAFNEGKLLMVEAGTGTGKSLAYLAPAASWALQQQSRVVISTHTINLQQQLLDKDIPLLEKALGNDIRAVVVKGKRNYICLRRWHELRRSSPQLMDEQEARWQARLVAWMAMTVTGDVTELNLQAKERVWWGHIAADGDACASMHCSHRDKCFLQALRRRAQAAHLLVVNHSLVMSDLSTQNRVLPRYDHIIFDEAHHLEGVASEHLSARASRDAFHGIYERLVDSRRGAVGRLRSAMAKEGLGDEEAFLALGQLSQDMVGKADAVFAQLMLWLDEHGQKEDSYARVLWLKPQAMVDSPAFLALSSKVEALTDTVERLERNALALRDQALLARAPVQEAQLEVARWAREAQELSQPLVRLVERDEDNTVFWLEEKRERREGRTPDIALVAAPIWVDELLYDELFSRLRSVVLTSATLTIDGSFTHSLERLGLSSLPSSDLIYESIPSPFRFHQQVLLGVPTALPIPRGKNTLAFEEALNGFLGDLLTITQGRTLILFTSHRMLRQAFHHLEEPMAQEDICLLAQGLSGSRSRLLEEFRASDRTVLMGTSSFWEGIDVPGPMLSCVVLVKLPFSPPNSPLLAARTEQLRVQGRSPFAELILPEAIMRVKQGFGRLIRSSTDRGVVLILDGRVLEDGSNYGSKFMNSLPGPCLKTGDNAEVLEGVREWLQRES